MSRIYISSGVEEELLKREWLIGCREPKFRAVAWELTKEEKKELVANCDHLKKI